MTLERILEALGKHPELEFQVWQHMLTRKFYGKWTNAVAPQTWELTNAGDPRKRAARVVPHTSELRPDNKWEWMLTETGEIGWAPTLEEAMRTAVSMLNGDGWEPAPRGAEFIPPIDAGAWRKHVPVGGWESDTATPNQWFRAYEGVQPLQFAVLITQRRSHYVWTTHAPDRRGLGSGSSHELKLARLQADESLVKHGFLFSNGGN